MAMVLTECCCFTLKTGAIILGLIDILVGSVMLYIATQLVEATHEVNNTLDRVFLGAGIGLAVLGALLLLVSFCLIIGALQGNPALLVPRLVYTIVLTIASIIPFSFFSVISYPDIAAILLVGYLIGNVIYFLIQIYFVFVVYSLYRKLKATAPPTALPTAPKASPTAVPPNHD